MGKTKEELIAAFGYDPTAELAFIGRAEANHKGEANNFEFYYNQSTGQIDVCHEGCNGTYMSGQEISDIETTLEPEFTKAFLEVKNRLPNGFYFGKKNWLGRAVVEWPGWPKHFDFFFDEKSGSIDVNYYTNPQFRGVLLRDGSTTLSPEFEKQFLALKSNPQKNMDDHEKNCGECTRNKTDLSRFNLNR